MMIPETKELDLSSLLTPRVLIAAGNYASESLSLVDIAFQDVRFHVIALRDRRLACVTDRRDTSIPEQKD
jgi:hypothetical protein